MDSTVCEIDTKVTTVQVDYRAAIKATEVTNTQSITDESALVSKAILTVVRNMISDSQTIYNTGFGDVIKAIYNTKNPSSVLNTIYFIPGGGNTTLVNQVLVS